MHFDKLRRREFITLVSGGALAATWPPAARAQQSGKPPTIGFLGADASAFAPWTAAFVARLHELGWIEGQTVAIEYRWSQGRTERYAEIAAEFVRRNVDAIVTVGSAVPSVRHATATIPIVFAVAIDPVDPAGGPVGSRHRQQLNGEFIAALLRDFRHGGPKAIERVRRTQPAAYLKILALLVPREHKVEHSNPLKEMRADRTRD